MPWLRQATGYLGVSQTKLSRNQNFGFLEGSSGAGLRDNGRLFHDRKHRLNVQFSGSDASED